ncbi:MAG: hypothetical protein RDV48_03520 [Candidatus Eremiobacteraeota bacterium]|nr:hypothetical protein [Candidatus Eremiobacteraeota bacterium]
MKSDRVLFYAPVRACCAAIHCRVPCLVLALYLLAIFSSLGAYSQQQSPQENDKAPLALPSSSSILCTVDFTKAMGDFPGGSIVMAFPADSSRGGEAGAGPVDVVKASGLDVMQLEIAEDFYNVFPDKSLDPSAPGSYRFADLDNTIMKAREQNLSLVFSFKASRFPDDVGKFRTQLEQVMKHLCIALGPGKALKAFLFDARPDEPGSYWNGKDDECLRLYTLFARSARKIDSSIPVGGCGFLNVFAGESEGTFKDVSPRLLQWIDGITRDKVPCDMLFFRHCGLIPYGFFLVTRTLEEKVLRGRPSLSTLFSRPKLYCAIEALPEKAPSLFRATVTVNALICAIKGGANYVAITNGSGEVSDPLTAALKECCNFSRYPVQLETVGLDRLCFIIMACRSKDGKSLFFTLSGNNPTSYLLSGEGGEDKAAMEKEYRAYVDTFTEKVFPPLYERYHLNIEGLPWGGQPILLRRYMLEGQNGLRLAEEKVLAGNKQFYFNKNFTQPGIQFLHLEVQEKPKEEKAQPSPVNPQEKKGVVP